MAGQQCGLILWLQPGLFCEGPTNAGSLLSFSDEVFPNAYHKQRCNASNSYISNYFHLLITLILYEINIPNPTKSKNKFTLYIYKIELKPKYCP
jgi:hypothetical protein